VASTLVSAGSGEHSITRRDLLAAIGSREAFDVLFYELTQKAVDAFSQTGKERCTLVLIGSLGTVDLWVPRACSSRQTNADRPTSMRRMRPVTVSGTSRPMLALLRSPRASRHTTGRHSRPST
jgi:hypothetical protein